METIKAHIKKYLVALAVAMLMFSPLLYAEASVFASLPAKIKIVDAVTGSPTLVLGSVDQPMPPGGYPFTVNVILEGFAQRLFTYQIAIKFDKTKLVCTAASTPENDSNFVFYGKKIVKGEPDILRANDEGDIFLGASLVNRGDAADAYQGVFSQVTFTAIKAGTLTLEIVPTTENSGSDYYGRDTFLAYLNGKDLVLMPFIAESMVIQVVTAPTPPIALFGINPTVPKAGQKATFDGSKSYDPDGKIISYVWDFGDGATTETNEASTTHAFDNNGVYNVKLTVYDNDGLSNAVVNEVMVGEPPSVAFTYSPMELWPHKGDTVTFSAMGSFDPDGHITNYAWEFGDGAKIETQDTTVTHVFERNGIYTAKLTVFDNDGLHSSKTLEVYVGTPPVADFVFSPENPDPDEQIVFNAYGSDSKQLTYDPDGMIVRAVWDFGDLVVVEKDVSELSELVIPHTYAVQGGVYTVTLTVFDDDGLYSSVSHDVNVRIIPKTQESVVPWGEYTAVGITLGAVVTAVAFKYKRKPEEESESHDFRVF